MQILLKMIFIFQVERRSAILNLISGTVTTVTATRSRESLPSGSDESNAPEQRRSSQSISGKIFVTTADSYFVFGRLAFIHLKFW